MSQKIIIENRTSLPLADAVEFAKRTVANGTDSDGHYTIQTEYRRFGANAKNVFVTSFKNADSHRFVVHYNDGKDHATA